MAVNFVSSSMSVNATASVVQTVVQKTGRSIRAGSNAKFVPNGAAANGEQENNYRDEGRLLKDLVAVLTTSRKQETNKAKPRSLSLLEKCNPDGGELHLAIASLNAATKEFSSLAEKMITIADSSSTAGTTSQLEDDHFNSNNTIVNEKEKTESRIYNENHDDDITTLDHSKPPSHHHLPASTNDAVAEDGNRQTTVSIDNNVVAVATAAASAFVCLPPPTTTGAIARNEATTATISDPRGHRPPLMEQKLDKLLDNVVKIKADMNQKIDRLSRRIDQIKLDVQLNIDSTDRSVCNNLLELFGLPYQKGENLQLYFRRICLLLGYQEPDIPLVDIRRKRVGTDNRSTHNTLDKTEPKSITSNTAAANQNKSKPLASRSKRGGDGDSSEDTTTVVIEFIFKNLRDAFYRAYLKKRTGIRLSELGLESDRRIYINEALTKLNQTLKSAALKKKREGLLHAVYTVDGAVYVQPQPGQKGRRVGSMGELE